MKRWACAAVLGLSLALPVVAQTAGPPLIAEPPFPSDYRDRSIGLAACGGEMDALLALGFPVEDHMKGEAFMAAALASPYRPIAAELAEHRRHARNRALAELPEQIRAQSTAVVHGYFMCGSLLFGPMR